MEGLRDAVPGETVARLAREWLREDVPSLDVGGGVVGSGSCEATLWLKASGVVCGRPFFDAVFSQLGCSVQWLLEEGQSVVVAPGQRLAAARVSG